MADQRPPIRTLSQLGQAVANQHGLVVLKDWLELADVAMELCLRAKEIALQTLTYARLCEHEDRASPDLEMTTLQALEARVEAARECVAGLAHILKNKMVLMTAEGNRRPVTGSDVHDGSVRDLIRKGRPMHEVRTLSELIREVDERIHNNWAGIR